MESGPEIIFDEENEGTTSVEDTTAEGARETNGVIVQDTTAEDARETNISGKSHQKTLEFLLSAKSNRRSTFGTVNKLETSLTDNGNDHAQAALAWTTTKSSGCTLPRPKVLTSFGKLVTTPGPGAYTIEKELRSKLETAPKYSLMSRKNPIVIDALHTPGPGAYSIVEGDVKHRMKKTRKATLKSAWDSGKTGPLPHFNFPGAMTYSPNALAVKFDSSVDPKLAMREPLKPRSTIDLRSLRIKERYDDPGTRKADLPIESVAIRDDSDLSKGAGIYNLEEKSTRIPMTIGENRPQTSPGGCWSPGPGEYETTGTEIGEIQCQSTNIAPHIVQSRHAQILRSTIRKSKHAALNPDYKSAYSFKKPLPSRMKRGASNRSSGLW